MIKKSQKRAFLELEKSLEQKFSGVRENVLTLVGDDFKDNKLKSSAFARIKDECWYIDYEDEVEISVPIAFKEGFRDSLELFATRELSKIKKDKKEARVHAGVLLAVGLGVLLAMALMFAFWERLEAVREAFFLTELLTIISWVFIWAAVSKWFFDQKQLHDQRFTLLQLLSAKIEYR